MPRHVLFTCFIAAWLAGPAFNGVFSNKVARALMRTRDPPRKRKREERENKLEGRTLGRDLQPLHT